MRVRPTARGGRELLRLLGAALLATTGGIHLDLYLTGYRYIPTVGNLFVLQVVSAFALAVLVAIVRKPLVALAGAGFAVATLAGYVLSLWVGLFGFKEIRTTAGVVAGVVELAAALVLGVYAFLAAPEEPTSAAARPLAVARRAFLPVLSLVAVVFVIATATSTGASSTDVVPPSSSTGSSMRVSIRNFAFLPAIFSVSPGETIVVTNHDSVDHTLTVTPGSGPSATFNTGDIAPGASASITAPTTPGSYPFDCGIHNFMTGTLTVT